MIAGFCKKVILSNNLSLIAEYAFHITDFAGLSVATAWFGALSYTLQIYFDFSGYSDMAIGLGRIFGFHFDENFNYPYSAESVTDFWRKWHISLSSWFRDYVYIPLGGSRVTAVRHILNLSVVWTLTGIWHGAAYTFVIWGWVYFILLVFEKYIVHPEKFQNNWMKWMYRIFTLACVNFAWVIFNSKNLHNGIRYCLAMVGLQHNGLYDSGILFYVHEYGVFFAIALVLSVPVARRLKLLTDRYQYAGAILALLSCAGYIGGLVYAVSFLIMGSHNPFIYFNF